MGLEAKYSNCKLLDVGHLMLCTTFQFKSKKGRPTKTKAVPGATSSCLQHDQGNLSVSQLGAGTRPFTTRACGEWVLSTTAYLLLFP